MIQAEFKYLFNRFRWRGERMGFVYGREILQAFDAMGLEPPFVFVILRARHSPAPAGLRNVAQRLGQFQYIQPLAGYLVFRGHCDSLIVGLGIIP
jgi:hypothetical protein